ncbi:threonine synthase [Pelagibacterium xiamenense]|uniref:threonine synthase n=1 Tax=Pelagibacterium xiamenense TaxID=2901140 RepID=UPI001E349367|nr:threonine synthase [Pelagibacterium xiamenense]MCD7059247.1 threonine synthase [Pelagibacterium xiamenense]
MRYVSTRGQAPALGFCDAVLAGLARDGGLYVPESWPQFTAEEMHNFANRHYEDVALAVISRFVGDEIPAQILKTMVKEAYQSFNHPSITPLVELEPGHFVLELWHGPTLAFKDVAMQFLARVMDYILGERGQRATIIGATSGDTGSAAIEAFKGRANTDIFILHPKGRTSAVQRRQMTTVSDANVHNIALEGTFDDCQAIVKDLFADHAFTDAAKLSGVNSINWGRIVAQIVYYFTSAIALGAPHRPVTFCVPTGNFGDIFAGYCAKKMGLPIEKLIVATNSNDILRRAIKVGRYDKRGVIPTASPSMDIEVSSNFERLLFEALDRDGEKTAALFSGLKQSGGFAIPGVALETIRSDFGAGMADETATSNIIRDVYAHSSYLIDPHTAVGVAVGRGFNFGHTPIITLSTAHPAKFPEAVEAATGVHPALPSRLGDLNNREERFTVLANDASAVEDFIRAKTRAWED